MLDVGEMYFKTFVVGADVTGFVLHFFLSHGLLQLGIKIMVTMALLNNFVILLGYLTYQNCKKPKV